MSHRILDDPTRATSAVTASRALLSAALGGLLCLSASACSSTNAGRTNATDAGPGDSGGDIVDAGVYDAPNPCDAGLADVPAITSSETLDAGLTLDEFTQMCNAKGGAVQIEPECGGHNACRGMSYDQGTQTLSYNTCRATNTCAGFSCIICN